MSILKNALQLIVVPIKFLYDNLNLSTMCKLIVGGILINIIHPNYLIIF